MKKYLITLLLVLAFLPVQNIDAQSANTGFVPGNIWYSKDPFEEGDKIKIYTLIFNPDTKELSGNVSFFDNSVLLGKKSFVVASRGVRDISIDWTVSVGAHKIYAKIENAKFLTSPGKYQEVDIASDQTEESQSTVGKKIVTPPVKAEANNNPTTTNSITSIEESIKENTPSVISTPILATTNALEGVRISASLATDNKKAATKTELTSLNNVNKKNTKAVAAAKWLKPFKYVELFFLTILSLIFKYKIIFYGILAVVLFYLVRYIFRLFF
jgi:hypothetical protein